MSASGPATSRSADGSGARRVPNRVPIIQTPPYSAPPTSPSSSPSPTNASPPPISITNTYDPVRNLENNESRSTWVFLGKRTGQTLLNNQGIHIAVAKLEIMRCFLLNLPYLMYESKVLAATIFNTCSSNARSDAVCSVVARSAQVMQEVLFTPGTSSNSFVVIDF
ncbi:hypothetical protein L1987_07914 [Smallanthus sonchifolius]|uniref:Uncharacterized protein n=1 Tax=Smallanthus sonchifolius TaxID=185202 RepID=A0ACB9JL15_9ASTR|nr:hypothetical protein L1987_07914 [Smallanthus sonchifolius]